MTLKEIGELIGCSKERVGILLNKMGKGFRALPKGGKIYDWEKFPSNWRELTDKEIAGIVGVKGNDACIVAQWRKRNGYVKVGSMERSLS
jgi:hypothetical protein